MLKGNPEFGCDLEPIDFAAYAKACGIEGYSASDPIRIETVLREALSHFGPVVVEALVDPYEPPMPDHVTTEQAVHFTDALLRGERDCVAIRKNTATERVRQII